MQMARDIKNIMVPFTKGNVPWCKGTKGLVKSWNKGKHNIYSKETLEKMSIAKKGKPTWNKDKTGVQIAWNKGKRGFMSKEGREKIINSNKTRKSWNKGKHNIYSKETLEKMSYAVSGNKSRFWKGGITSKPYSVNWNKTLRRSIRERDKYICQLCGELQSDRAFAIHHIDYDKKNCNPNNLITLCMSCHSKTNLNREFWKSFFENLKTIEI
jgi:hypothetical protein